MKELNKVTAYIIRVKENKYQLLTFLEEGVESFGLQVPGGTLEAGETLEECLVREIYEEARLEDIILNSYLGQISYPLEEKDTIITRHFYQLSVDECEEAFTIVVQSNDEDNGWIYKYRWIDLSPDHFLDLGGKLGRCLNELYRELYKK
ncbi:8-oxo-dGTP pyrophosphatase MutT, NUDIX family [Paenibacillaceae bacterium GAS479]|nr:8-oxo-dGTP pyrophosphatase MutT, NUDIX family [Paenibacillaceae bacterium GAS479]